MPDGHCYLSQNQRHWCGVDDQQDIPPERIEAAQNAASLLEDGARKVGLYAQQVRLGANEDGSRMVLMADFLIGDVAWSDRIQHPERYDDTTTFKQIERDLMTDKFTELRDEMQRRADAGLPPLAGNVDDDEDD